MKKCKNLWLVAGGCLFAVGLMSNAARAQYTSSDTRLPSPTYRSANPTLVTYSTPSGQYRIDSFFDVFADFQRVPEPTQPNEIHSFFDVFTEIDLAPPGGAPVIRDAPSQQIMRLNGLPPGTPYPHAYQTEMLQLNLSGGGLPAGVMIRESPTLASTGQTTITNVGGGLFLIDSFFDVFTELSLDGGQSWTPSNGALHISGNTPEPSSVMLALLGALTLSGFGTRRGNR
jgi:hypothetical protein